MHFALMNLNGRADARQVEQYLTNKGPLQDALIASMKKNDYLYEVISSGETIDDPHLVVDHLGLGSSLWEPGLTRIAGGETSFRIVYDPAYLEGFAAKPDPEVTPCALGSKTLFSRLITTPDDIEHFKADDWSFHQCVVVGDLAGTAAQGSESTNLSVDNFIDRALGFLAKSYNDGNMIVARRKSSDNIFYIS